MRTIFHVGEQFKIARPTEPYGLIGRLVIIQENQLGFMIENGSMDAPTWHTFGNVVPWNPKDAVTYQALDEVLMLEENEVFSLDNNARSTWKKIENPNPKIKVGSWIRIPPSGTNKVFKPRGRLVGVGENLVIFILDDNILSVAFPSKVENLVDISMQEINRILDYPRNNFMDYELGCGEEWIPFSVVFRGK